MNWFPMKELAAGRWHGRLLDDTIPTRQPIPGTAIHALAVTLYVATSSDVPADAETISPWDAYDVLHGGSWDRGVTVGSDGTIEWLLTASDNAIVDPDGNPQEEKHVAMFEGTYGDAERPFVHRVGFRVENLRRRPAS